MKAITIWQPWASLIACGAKQYKTGSWATSYRGPIAIHAAAVKVPQVLKKLFPMGEWCYTSDYTARLRFLDIVAKGLGGVYTTEELMDTLNGLPTGSVIATAELVNVWHITSKQTIPRWVNGVTPLQRGDDILVVLEKAEEQKNKTGTKYFYHLGASMGEIALGDWTPGRYAWELANVKILQEPIPVKGKQGLWNWESEQAGGQK